MTEHTVIPAWSRDFNNQRRHCWPRTDGTLVFEDSGSTWYDEPRLCDGDHDPKLVGQVEWMRFIHAFGRLAPLQTADGTVIENPFGDEEGHVLLNEVDGHRTSDGRHTYCETYLRRKPNSWGVNPVFRVFLANEDGWARIECYDPELVGMCELALHEVEQSYRAKEVTA